MNKTYNTQNMGFTLFIVYLLVSGLSNVNPLDTQFVVVLVVSESFEIFPLLHVCSVNRQGTRDCTLMLKSMLVINLFS